MIRRCASFRWNVAIGETERQPFAGTEVANLVGAIRAAGIDVAGPEDADFAWNIRADLVHIGMDCKLGFVEKTLWLLTCSPYRRTFMDWLLQRSWQQEQMDFLKRLDGVLRAQPAITDLRWFTQEEWDQVTAGGTYPTGTTFPVDSM